MDKDRNTSVELNDSKPSKREKPSQNLRRSRSANLSEIQQLNRLSSPQNSLSHIPTFGRKYRSATALPFHEQHHNHIRSSSSAASFFTPTTPHHDSSDIQTLLAGISTEDLLKTINATNNQSSAASSVVNIPSPSSSSSSVTGDETSPSIDTINRSLNCKNYLETRYKAISLLQQQSQHKNIERTSSTNKKGFFRHKNKEGKVKLVNYFYNPLEIVKKRKEYRTKFAFIEQDERNAVKYLWNVCNHEFFDEYNLSSSTLQNDEEVSEEDHKLIPTVELTAPTINRPEKPEETPSIMDDLHYEIDLPQKKLTHRKASSKTDASYDPDLKTDTSYDDGKLSPNPFGNKSTIRRASTVDIISPSSPSPSRSENKSPTNIHPISDIDAHKLTKRPSLLQTLSKNEHSRRSSILSSDNGTVDPVLTSEDEAGSLNLKTTKTKRKRRVFRKQENGTASNTEDLGDKKSPETDNMPFNWSDDDLNSMVPNALHEEVEEVDDNDMKKEYMYQIESESMKQIQQIKNTLQDFFPRLDIPVHSLEIFVNDRPRSLDLFDTYIESDKFNQVSTEIDQLISKNNQQIYEMENLSTEISSKFQSIQQSVTTLLPTLNTLSKETSENWSKQLKLIQDLIQSQSREKINAGAVLSEVYYDFLAKLFKFLGWVFWLVFQCIKFIKWLIYR